MFLLFSWQQEQYDKFHNKIKSFQYHSCTGQVLKWIHQIVCAENAGIDINCASHSTKILQRSWTLRVDLVFTMLLARSLALTPEGWWAQTSPQASKTPRLKVTAQNEVSKLACEHPFPHSHSQIQTHALPAQLTDPQVLIPTLATSGRTTPVLFGLLVPLCSHDHRLSLASEFFNFYRLSKPHSSQLLHHPDASSSVGLLTISQFCSFCHSPVTSFWDLNWCLKLQNKASSFNCHLLL